MDAAPITYGVSFCAQVNDWDTGLLYPLPEEARHKLSGHRLHDALKIG